MHSRDAVTGSFCASRREFLGAALCTPQLLRSWLERGIDLRLRLVEDGSAPDVAAGARMSLDEATRAATLLGSTIAWSGQEASVVVFAGSADMAQEMGDGVVVMNAALPADALRRQHPWMFHIAATRAGFDALWDGNAERFGAAQLNARYQHAYGKAMTAHAWAGWFAVKAAWEAALRTRSADAGKIAAYLTNGSFDGHKGRPLRFDATTRILK